MKGGSALGRRWGTRTVGVVAALALLLSTVGMIAAPGIAAAALPGTISSAGPLTKIFISADLNCAVDHAGDSHGEFYEDTACGTFVAVGNTTYGPATVPAGPKDPGTSAYKKFTKISQTAVTGTGTAANPFKIVTVVAAGSTGVRLTQTDTYVTGQESYRTDVAVAQTGLSPTNVVLYRAGDCFLQNDDNGFGSYDASTGAIACVNGVLNGSGQRVPGSRIEQWSPISAGSRYVHGLFSSVWAKVLSRQPLPNTCTCATYQDNGAGLSWSISLLPGQSLTRSHLLTFQSVASSPLVTSKTADHEAVSPGATTGYTITLTNPNATGVTLTSVTDDLPAGFTYRSGSSSGVTTANPVASNQHLSWSGPFIVPSNGQVTLHFGVTASTQPGDYFNRAGGAASGSATVTPTGDTAKVTVLGAASLTIAADRGSVAASPSSISSADVPLQRTSPHVQSAPIIQLPLLSSPIIQLPLLSSPIIQLPLLSSPIIQLPLLSSPIIQLPLLSSAFGFDSLADNDDLGSSPAVRAGLARISLAAMRITSGPDWPTRLAGTALADRQLQTVTFADVLALGLPAEKIPALAHLDLSASPLGQLSSLSLFMGDTRLQAIGGAGFGWCGKLESLGHADCGAALGVQGSPDKGLSASLLSLEIAGVNPDAIDGLKSVLVRDVTFPAEGQASLPAVQLASFDLASASVGGILIRTLATADAVVDCTKVDCSAASTKTVYDASQAGALRPSATIGALGAAAGGLTLQEAVLGAYSSDAANPYDVAANQLGVLGYGGAGASEVAYHVEFNNQIPLTHPSIEATLPHEFRYKAGSAVVRQNGVPVSGVGEPTVVGEILTWSLGDLTVAAGRQLTVDFLARPGLRTGRVNATVIVTGDDFSLNAATAAPLTVAENFETGDEPGTATTIVPGRLQFGHMGHAGDVDYYAVPAPTQPGSHLNVYLTCATCDADLVLFHPASAKPHNPMRPAAAVPAIQPELDQGLGLASSGEPLQPLALDDIPLIDLPVAGISANRGTESEAVEALTWDTASGGTYLIQVSSYLGSISPDAYTLRATVSPPAGAPPPGAARSFSFEGDVATDTPPIASFDGVKTLVLADRNRLRRAYGATRAQIALDAIQRLAASPDLGIKVLFLDALPEIQAAFAVLDARPSDPERSNDVVRAINARVDTLLGAHRGSVQNIVLVGTDEIVPMARIPDLTATANEREFAQELAPLAVVTGGNNALVGAAASGAILTDDPYCAFAPRPFLGTFLYMPDAACGRLVESPEDIAAVIDQFLAPSSSDGPGVLRPSRSLVTGYDFMAPLAEAIKTTFENQLTPGQVASLISESWKRSDLQAALPGANPVPDIVAAMAHYNPSALLPPDPSEGLFTTEAFGGATPPEIARRIVLTMGCHSGFSISNFLSFGGAAPDWPETLLKGGVAAFVGNTGSGIGLRSTIAFSAKVMADFAGNMAKMPLGRALVEAKRGYLGGATPNVYDYKVLAQATYFGLPMFRVAGAGDGPPPPPAPRSTVTDGPTGLTAADVAVSNPADQRWRLVDNGEGKYYQLDPGRELTVSPNRPIQPKVTLDVHQPGLEARGALLTGLTSIDENNFNPALARTVTGRAANETEVQFGDVIFPTALQSVDNNTLALTAAQFESGPAGTIAGLERRFTQINARVFYVPPATPHGAPVFRSISADKNGPTASFKAVVEDPGGGVVRQVAVLFNDGTTNAWTFRQLAQAADGSWVGGFAVNSDHLQYIGQAVTDRGDLAITTNKGDNFDFATRPPGTAEIHAQVAGEAANGWYADGATVTLSGPEGTSFSVSDNGGAPSTWSSGQPIPVSGTGVHTLHYVASPGGETGDVTVPVDTTKPTIAGAPTAPPNSHGWYGGPVIVRFTCADSQSGVATCEPDRTLSSDGTGQSVTGQAVDGVGNTDTATVGGINIDTTPPTIERGTHDDAERGRVVRRRGHSALHLRRRAIRRRRLRS